MAYDKAPCELCGELVSMHPMSQKKHERECKMNTNPIIESENKMVEPTQKKDDAVFIKDAEARKMYDIAMQTQETRKKSPELFVAGLHSDERRELIKRYTPECVDPPFNPRSGSVRKFAEWHAFWSSPEKALSRAHKAYIPVFNEHGTQVQNKGDVLFKIQRKMWLDGQVAASKESAARKRSISDHKLKKLSDNAGEGITISSSKTEEAIQ